jgi:hypothetical protein
VAFFKARSRRRGREKFPYSVLNNDLQRDGSAQNGIQGLEVSHKAIGVLRNTQAIPVESILQRHLKHVVDVTEHR